MPRNTIAVLIFTQFGISLISMIVTLKNIHYIRIPHKRGRLTEEIGKFPDRLVGKLNFVVWLYK